jgi:hypothetical protein
MEKGDDSERVIQPSTKNEETLNMSKGREKTASAKGKRDTAIQGVVTLEPILK